MAPVRLTVQVTSGANLGGIYPFVVVCFDGNVAQELHKTAAVRMEGNKATWNETFTIDLTTHMKNMAADGRGEPKYLTFFVFDTGAQDVPSLGSAGVLLDTVKEHGRAHGDFQMVNGTGSLSLAVLSEKADKEGFFQSDKGKTAAKVGGAAVAIGLGALAVHKYRKHRKQKHDGEGGLAGSAARPWYDPNTSSDEE
ncbi:hypothetical protein BWQ96_02979 [Gracilariopsis chorda]|uniref:C2 domain-containing protein n=1 Tax=Gracilariopsis chorda TaxID=448386 RepID=A0A2V3IYI7_9FLOR|nr:hypothetical protein BWQ96_02979 [Gracilariopsis chorda]|eukprot:PXF47204.1 hypothetical protein BWQ96_02979 [Gracilariopsis chorda]